jgi:hypothetical protein
MARKCPHCKAKVGDYADKCWKCKQPLDGTVAPSYSVEYSPRKGGGNKVLKIIIPIVIICIVIFAVWFLVLSEQEEGEVVSYDSYFDFMNDWSAPDGKLNIGRVSEGDTVRIEDTIYSIYYDSSDGNTYFQFDSFYSEEALEQGYDGVIVGFKGDLTNRFEVDDEVVIKQKIISDHGHELADGDNNYTIDHL